jgi:2'-hydroxyisoflavone reductase
VRILVVGGTSFVGRAISWAAIGAGHEVTVVNRGVTPSDLPTYVERLVGDRGVDLSVLTGRHFDATVDCIAYRPRDVEVLYDALGERGGLHLQISSVSAYATPDHALATEPELELWGDEGLDLEGPINATTYGPLKAACERVALERFGDAVALVRPTYVIGAHDKTLRFPYWAERCRRGGRVVAPGPLEAPLQWVDARDLAALVVHLLATGYTGALHACAPSGGAGYVETIERVLAHVGPEGSRVEVIDPTTLSGTGLTRFFPLWPGEEPDPLGALDSSRAVAHGLVTRPLEESVDEVVAWWGDRDWPDQWLTPEAEAALLAP